MGIFNFSSSNPKDQNQAPLKISEPVLTSLGLTQDDIDSHNKNVVQQEAIKYGTSYYKEVAQEPDITSSPPVKLGPIALNTNTKNVTDLVDSLKSQIVQMEPVMPPEDFEKIKISLEGFAKGYGEAALEAKDWQTAIKALDNSTPDGIEKNTEVLTKLGQMFAADKETRISIASIIQERINDRSTKSSPINSQEPAQSLQTPISPLSQPKPTQTTPKPVQPVIDPLNVQQSNPTTPSPIISPTTTPIASLANEKLPGEITDSNGIILRPVPKMPNNLANLTS